MTKALWRRLVPPVLVLLVLNGLVFAAYTVPRALQVRNAKARAADASTLGADETLLMGTARGGEVLGLPVGRIAL